MIRKVTIEDAPQIMDIYNYYVDHSIVTFDINHSSLEQIQGKIKTTAERFPWIVYEVDGEILGYAHGSEWKAKDGYKYSTETTVYLKHDVIKKVLGPYSIRN